MLYTTNGLGHPMNLFMGCPFTLPNFFGTSAAAPHAAAVAALMIEAQRFKTITPSQIKGIMTANSVDMDDPRTPGFSKGFDYTTGYGLLKADAAVAAVRFPAVYIKNLSIKAICSDDPAHFRRWTINNPNPFDVDIHWLVIGRSQHGDLTVPPGESTYTSETAYSYNRLTSNVALIDWEDNFGFPHFDIAASTRAQCGKDLVSAENMDNLSENVVAAETIDKPNSVALYPNPSSKNFRVYLSFSKKQNVDLNLYTLDGKLLYKKVVGSAGVVDIDAAGYKPGIYILKVKQQEFSTTFKLVRK